MNRLSLSGLWFGLLFTSLSPLVSADTAVQNLDQLLQQVVKTKQQDAKENKQREAAFVQRKSERKKLLADATNRLAGLQQQSEVLEQKFSSNEKLLQDKRKQLQQRMGDLKELFGHLTAASGDFRGSLSTSIISAQYPGRDQVFDALIEKMEQATLLPEIGEIEALWFEIMREMTESSKVAAFEAEVVTPDGKSHPQKLLRIGSFNLVTVDKYLGYSAEDGSVFELPRQPATRYTTALADLQNATGPYARIGIDPTGPSGGSYLAALVDSPTLLERWHQGGIVGYIISAIGAIALSIILWRLGALILMESAIGKSLKTKSGEVGKHLNNALGRVLQVHLDHPDLDAETLEVKLSEAILRERPAIERFLPLLRIIAMVAPLLGLLGTVAGMIMTFQAITIYGAGDPKTMAGGISSALVTTVLGLLVAIPTVFAHALLNGKAQKILHILEQQGMGLIARHTGTGARQAD